MVSEIKQILETMSNEYWFCKEEDSLLQSFHDFNREIIEPGVNDNFTEGAVGIRVDDDFWVAAILPYEMRKFSIEELVAAIWPDITDARFNPDT